MKPMAVIAGCVILLSIASLARAQGVRTRRQPRSLRPRRNSFSTGVQCLLRPRL